MDINKKIVKSLLEKNYSDMKDLVYKSLYAAYTMTMKVLPPLLQRRSLQ